MRECEQPQGVPAQQQRPEQDAVEPREDRLDDRRLRLVGAQDAREVQDPEEETGQHHRLQRSLAATHRQHEQREQEEAADGPSSHSPVSSADGAPRMASMGSASYFAEANFCAMSSRRGHMR